MSMLLILVAMFAIFYFMMIRPQRKRQNAHRDFIESLESGDHVITAGGIYGEIEEVNLMDIVIKVEDGTKLRILKTSIVAGQQNSSEDDSIDDEVDEIEEGEIEEESEDKAE